MSKMTMSEAGHIGGQKTKIFWKNKYLQQPKTCKYCGKQIPFEKKDNLFCDSSCAASFNNKGIKRNAKNKEVNTCANCGKITSNKKYCSKLCYHGYAWKTIDETGKLIPTNSGYGYSPGCSKKYLKAKRGHRCEICGNTKWLGQEIPLLLDHINGNPGDHSLLNVRLICGNCNMLLPTFAGRNKGNGRRDRKKNFGA